MRLHLSVTTALLIGLFSLIADGSLVAANTSSNLNGTTWQPLRIGAGGFITGIDISRDGSTRVIRTDTYGAYVWNSMISQWQQLVTSDSMPVADVTVDKFAGVYEIRVAPNTPTRLYMMYLGSIYRSDNTGATWTKTAFSPVVVDANDPYRMWCPKMAVDPANPDVVYVGTPQNGLFVTMDGGMTWQRVSAVPVSQQTSSGLYPGITGIAFDPSSSTTGGRTNTIYASSYGNGVYRSSDAGATWRALTGGPANVRSGKIATDAAYYAIGNERTSVWRFASGVWTNITPDSSQSWDGILVDPLNSARVVAVREGGYLDQSSDRGATWGGIIWGNGYPSRVATDIPWLAWTNEGYMGVGDMMFDPVTPDQIWFAEGIGVWYTTLSSTAPWNVSTVWTSQSIGIEQLVAMAIAAPPGGKPVVSQGDRPVFYVSNPDVFPSKHGPDNQYNIVAGWDVDYASTNPSFIAGLFNWPGAQKSAYSTDGGQTWTPFATYPADAVAGKIGGCIAASTPTNIVWVPSNNSQPYYTQNGGATWTQVLLPGVPTSGETGWGFSMWLNRHIVAADRVTAGTFYMYNYLTGLYRSTNGGTSWALVFSGQIAPWSGFNAKLRAAPGQAGHLFFTSGQLGNAGDPNPAASPLMRSTDGGVTWTAVPNVLEVYAIGFGQAPVGGTYPTIFIAGWVNNVWGIWRSDDNAQTWIQIGNFPLGSLDQVRTIDGDKNVYGMVYVGFSGSGYAYGVTSSTPTASASGGASGAAAPAVAINSPANGTTLKGKGNVSIASSASDPSGIAAIIVKGDGNTLQKCTNATSCSATWKNPGQGSHTISATAINNAGMAASASVSVLSLR
jgi:Bacterial Ig domain/BNR/Asp-box repeat